MPDADAGEVRIVPFAPRHAPAWKALNEAWITRLFALEPKDRPVLDDPEGVVLARGGHLLMAEITGRPVGCCALIPLADGGFELAKMAVDETLRGRGIGRRLMAGAVDLARVLGAPRLYIETNSALDAAVRLYEAFGFQRLEPRPSAYDRVDLWMELRLDR